MKRNPNSQRPARRAFTLIELLVVISIMGILAALILPVAGAVNRQKVIRLVQSKMSQVETAIEAYKAKKGFYPPDNALSPQIPGLNPLFYELTGTVYTNGVFSAIKRFETIGPSDITRYFGLGGFVNSSTDPSEVQDFYPTLRGADYAEVASPPIWPDVVEALVVSVRGPGISVPSSVSVNTGVSDQPPKPGQINPWRYVSSTPTNNPSSYDLWVDIVIGSKAYRICNWSKDPIGL
jgi:prepilin-type N-terminal cleavage/methylation domain-containing protein